MRDRGTWDESDRGVVRCPWGDHCCADRGRADPQGGLGQLWLAAVKDGRPSGRAVVLAAQADIENCANVYMSDPSGMAVP